MAEERAGALEIVWDEKMKKDVVGYIRDLGDRMRDYFSCAVEYVNEQQGEPKEQYWRNLFCPERDGKDSIQKERGGLSAEKCPENPYQEQDIQAMCKYLLFGKNRSLPQGEQDDSQYYYKFFQIERSGPHERRVREKPYEKNLRTAMDHRNHVIGHSTKARETAINWDFLRDVLDNYKALTQCMERNDQWRAQRLDKVEDFWKQVDREVLIRFGSEPLSLRRLGEELFFAETLSEEELKKLEEVGQKLRLKIENGMVYEEPSKEALLEQMRWFLGKGEMTAEAAEEVLEEQRREKRAREELRRQVEEREAQLSAPLWAPLPQREARVLRQAGTLLRLTETLWQTILSSFQILVDESLFLAPEGRKLLMELQSVLAARHAKLPVDASVVGTIFRQFRSSVPYTALELADMEPESREEMQQLRQEVHQEAKTAIKMLRHLREHSCLEVVNSPTDSRNSYENIAWLARQYPQTRFLVLTLDRQLAEELSQIRGRNAVAAKPDLDGNLFLFRATRAVYSHMTQPAQEETQTAVPAETALHGKAGGDTAPAPRSSGAGEQRDTVFSVRRIPVQGEMITAAAADGVMENLHLGKFLNNGGEGSIYLTSREDLVAKIYLPKHLTQRRLEKLQHMIASNPNIAGLCWPNALLYNNLGEWIGFLMPKAEGKELATTVFTPGRGCCNIQAMGWSRRHLVTIAGNIAGLFAEMHKQGILMGDVNPRNFMVRSDCTVYFVDCDSYQFDNFSCPVFSPLFLPPEVHARMRATPGGGSSSFVRTQENELYSIAVLLFEVLFLGKAPYESRNTNNDDVVQAIISGDFPYPYKGDDEEEEEQARSAMLAPVGRWRNIWSHMPYFVKTGFYNAFTKKSRLSASAWAQTMWDYRNMIENGKSNDELLPTTYKVLINQDGTEAAKMVDLVCEQCGAPFNQSEEVVRRRQKYGEKVLCDTCRNQRRIFERRPWTVRCDCCGREYRSSVAAWMDHEEKGKPLYCPDCVSETVTCSRCRRLYSERREKVNRLREKGQALLCPDCFQKMFTQVTCSECGAVYRDRTETVESFRRNGRPLLCPKCRGQRRANGAEKEEAGSPARG